MHSSRMCITHFNGHLGGGGCLPRVVGVCTGGICLEGVCQGGCTPLGPRGRHPLSHSMLGYIPLPHSMLGYTPPRTESQTGVKTLSSPQLRLQVVKSHLA